MFAPSSPRITVSGVTLSSTLSDSAVTTTVAPGVSSG
jgi:hypothetical protein